MCFCAHDLGELWPSHHITPRGFFGVFFSPLLSRWLDLRRRRFWGMGEGVWVKHQTSSSNWSCWGFQKPPREMILLILLWWFNFISQGSVSSLLSRGNTFLCTCVLHCSIVLLFMSWRFVVDVPVILLLSHLVTSAKEVMYSVWFGCLSVSKITQKLPFSWNLVEGCSMGQGRTHSIWEWIWIRSTNYFCFHHLV